MDSNPEKRRERTGGKRGTVLYNLLFPVWFLYLIPRVWLFIIPANFIIDSLVLLAALHVLKIPGKMEIYRRSILKIWGIGFLSDLLSAGLLFLLGWILTILDAPFTPFGGLACVLISLPFIGLAGWLIFRLNRRFSFRGTELAGDRIRRICLVLALATAPYLMMIPTYW